MLPKAYDPSGTEDRIYAMWEESGAFTADANSTKESFTVSMPPPNATGTLHLGHAVMLALEDIFIRFQRMQGKEALWVPGTDHAAIATESVVIKKIQEEEKMKDPRGTLGREELLKRIAAFVADSQSTIRSQVKKMGSSCDWSRERYTMDASLNRCVNEVFVKMYKDGLIYRGHRIVNWDPKMQTTVADDEIEYKEERDPFYWFQYGPFVIGTVRPETKFGDKYVVMHPDDERYKDWKHGDTFECEWINGPITATVIKDKAVDPEFGSGVMTITPWHSQVDFEIAERHKLDKEQIIDFEGRLISIGGEFAGMHIADARSKIVEKLEQKGLLVKIDENYVHNVSLSYRGKGVIEPQIKEQWFVDVHKPVVLWKDRNMSLKEVLQDVIRSGDIRIIPDRFEKTYFSWIDNLRDWCISRQIWWGHRAPVWYKSDDQSSDIHVGVQPPKGDGWQQDSDTLDTWFSSALWTWSTLVDPALTDDYSLSLEDILKRSPDFQKFHPTSVMETGYDIIFFWVARMILMTTYATGQIPFKTVYLHGLVRTRDGKKMSKSDPKSAIDPLDVISRYGADALRLSMIVGQSPGNDSKLFEEKIAGYRNFVNKLWNASRFVLMQCEEAGKTPGELGKPFDLAQGRWGSGELGLADKALLSALQQLIDDVTNGLAEYRLSEVGERIYSFVWDYFCDWYLELSKGNANLDVLVHTLRTTVHLLHPYCPFVTEELWAHIRPDGTSDSLMKQPWPVSDTSLIDADAQNQLQVIIDVITAIRSLRSEQGIDPAQKLNAVVHAGDHVSLVESQREHIIRLGRLESLAIDTAPVSHKNALSAFLKQGIEVHIPLEGLIDVDKERERLQKEERDITSYITGIEKKLSNAQFVDNAPAEVVEAEKEKQRIFEEKLQKISARLSSLG